LGTTNTFLIIVRDLTPPVITLNGANPFTLPCHGAFSDPGASAYDAVAGAVTVTTTGTVDVNTPGAYTIQYSATDPSGNTTNRTRTVFVTQLVLAGSIGTAGAGGIQLSFSAAAGQTYRVFAAEDLTLPLTNWSLVATGIVSTNPVVFIDSTKPTNAGRYYRVGSP
jgi:hypothetical protein